MEQHNDMTIYFVVNGLFDRLKLNEEKKTFTCAFSRLNNKLLPPSLFLDHKEAKDMVDLNTYKDAVLWGGKHASDESIAVCIIAYHLASYSNSFRVDDLFAFHHSICKEIYVNGTWYTHEEAQA